MRNKERTLEEVVDDIFEKNNVRFFGTPYPYPHAKAVEGKDFFVSNEFGEVLRCYWFGSEQYR